ncbi:hypothetical protein F5J12DRAFT_845950 [Pisolithus orientalis]|uniref:uncharacterized protein n=1 Tax=Pisolithus orientalis TaxID=936130 RepID=UPI002224193E|nr:uncharacterized protein F5J12DRAFT_845950 [Pisolithus orientalis]KAI6000398.1 hypothetical protein F5J12DRAFT_845950 [Pisolithus orientalis]
MYSRLSCLLTQAPFALSLELIKIHNHCCVGVCIRTLHVKTCKIFNGMYSFSLFESRTYVSPFKYETELSRTVFGMMKGFGSRDR